MATLSRAAVAAGLCAVVLSAGCATAPKPAAGIYQTPPGLGQYPYSDADIEFMSGMIPHHAQAVVMANWAKSHGAREDVAILCERIAVAQTDEIKMMRQWLLDRGLPAPDATSTKHHMKMANGMEHDMLMPGMLTDDQLKQLDAARGAAFDRAFLTFMIQHHTGAITMVKELFATYGAVQDQAVFKFASDVNVDQTTEVTRMRQMLALLTLGKRP